MPVFHNTRVLVEPEPKSMRNLPSGVVPAVRQPLAEDKSLLPFFSDERVIRAAGGAGALSDWLLRHVKSCQWPLGLVIVKPGRESMPVFHNTRVLVEPEPKSMRNLPSGVVPAVRQPLAEDKSLLPFFSDERVIRAAGGAGALSDWLLRHVKSCQWPHGDYHHSETVIHRYGTGAMVLCWHCDNQLRDQTSESLGQLAHQNLFAWMIDVIRHAMNGSQERELSLAELSWWAVRNQVADALPEAVLRRSLGLRAEKIRSMYRESDIVPGEQTATSILKQRTKNLAPLPHAHQQNPPQEKTVVSIAVDPESPAQYLQRQKSQREEMPVYTRWVKTQKCMTCGNQADDPHHIIGHGLGGMGTKADDLFVIPLCRKCHSELHAGVKDFEEKHGSQLLLLIRFLMHARNSGVLKWKA
ncbi:DUF968 domain-containing protein [Escherichia coli]